VGAFVRQLAAQGALPEDGAVLAVQGEDSEFVDVFRGNPPHATPAPPSPTSPAPLLCRFLHGRRFANLLGRLRLADLVGLDSGQQEDPVAPHDRGGVALARNLDLPANILLFAPLEGRVTVRCNTRPIRAAPLRPLTRRVGKQLQPRQRNGDERAVGPVGKSRIALLSTLDGFGAIRALHQNL
jgi:hypothetical protein